MNRVRIAPSVLSADLARLGDEIRDVESGGADIIHLDVIDGRFAPNITWGQPLVRAARGVTKLPLDVHLMIVEPDRHIEGFAEAGADVIGIHVEADLHAPRTLTRIRSFGKKSSITLNPQTGLESLDYLLEFVDQVLLMSVNPGFSGQKFLPSVLPKVRALRERIDRLGLAIDIEVDGGVDDITAPQLIEAGANILVSGQTVFGSADRAKAIRRLRGAGS